MKWVHATTGEELFLLIREDVLPLLPSSPAVWRELRDLLTGVGGTPNFHSYVNGAVATKAARRLVRFCAEATEGAADTTHVRIVSKFVTEEVFPGLESRMTGRVARLVVEATRVSGRDISSATRKKVLRGMGTITCYLCGHELSPTAADGDEAFLGIDHIWPSSMGGENFEENALPACRTCQVRKGDGASWEWISVHNLVWSAAPSEATTSKMPRETRIARHVLRATEVATANRCTLKEAFLQIGAMTWPSSFTRTGLPTTFFDLQTSEA